MSIYKALKQGQDSSESWKGEHHGHADPHIAGSLDNHVKLGGPNKTVYINNILAATKTTPVSSSCGCCDTAGGEFKQWSQTVYICGENAVSSKDSAFSINHMPYITSPKQDANVFLGN